jgi:hypothetical protein
VWAAVGGFCVPGTRRVADAETGFGDDFRAAAKADSEQVSSKREKQQKRSTQTDLARQDEA